MRDNTRHYRELFLDDVPMMDVRAPVEYLKGAFPNTVNLPLMNDIERQKVGTCYKQHGQQAAIALGHELVCGATKTQRIEAWAAFARAHADGYLYCFRGGLRSQIVQQWLKSEAGIDYPRVVGGYKAMRGFLFDTTRAATEECQFVLLGGLTGTGKTEVIAELSNALDLEGHANHRGSSFGRRATPQPAQIDFENRLAIDILKKRHAGIEQFVLEDEGRIVGSCSLPLELYQGMQQYPLVWLEDSFAGRVERILKDYVIDLRADFEAVVGAEGGFDAFAAYLRKSLSGIVKRLGGERYQRLAAIMEAALQEQDRSGAVDLHRGWIEGLLGEYYDPMYAFQQQSKAARIEFRGNRHEVLEYLRERARR
ncbi:tRNA 2-selenouridine(34) synthase MnmH [Pseudomonas panipatensis]|uniref:tRNA 2-selenouridine synthase n=1 Tax=Pseudomonas panipatensis TaxID=428992 RepID=A0A1G8F5A2_9PSED|nr:tRNA 2-selenouridine(34) synthase MnmH [Pseudomonas panipatensis]SDH77311.1 tRNA 2-selenouridine synthase [Pseudomonas panipatensis]SMP55289.1 tRNA 2-selenouridine synthase [Pseudomonas panipatensis]